MNDARTFRPFDDPIGNWHRCPHCKEIFFKPVREAIAGPFNHCPSCGQKVNPVDKPEE